MSYLEEYYYERLYSDDYNGKGNEFSDLTPIQKRGISDSVGYQFYVLDKALSDMRKALATEGAKLLSKMHLFVRR